MRQQSCTALPLIFLLILTLFASAIFCLPNKASGFASVQSAQHVFRSSHALDVPNNKLIALQKQLGELMGRQHATLIRHHSMFDRLLIDFATALSEGHEENTELLQNLAALKEPRGMRELLGMVGRNLMGEEQKRLGSKQKVDMIVQRIMKEMQAMGGAIEWLEKEMGVIEGEIVKLIAEMSEKKDL